MVVQGTLDPGFETDVEVAAGASYYFEVAPRPPRTPAEVIALAAMRIPGVPMPGRGIISGLRFYALDPSVGAAKIANMQQGR